MPHVSRRLPMPVKQSVLALLGLLAVLTLGSPPGRADKPEAKAAGPFDVLIRGGTVYDGSGKEPVRADVGIKGDKVVAVGDLAKANARTVIDARGLAVAPGFINMLSWSNESLLADGRSESEIRQGVTTEIMGEGWSMGPLNDAIKRRMKAEQMDIHYDIEWTTLADYLHWLERKQVSCNEA